MRNCLHVRRNFWCLIKASNYNSISIYMPCHFFLNKFLKEIEMIIIVVFRVWISHLKIYSHLLPVSASLFLKKLYLWKSV